MDQMSGEMALLKAAAERSKGQLEEVRGQLQAAEQREYKAVDTLTSLKDKERELMLVLDKERENTARMLDEDNAARQLEHEREKASGVRCASLEAELKAAKARIHDLQEREAARERERATYREMESEKESERLQEEQRRQQGLSPEDEGRLLALQDHLADVTQRLARAEKMRDDQTKEASRALGQLEVMRTRLAEYQRRAEREEDVVARSVADGDKKAGVIRQLREELTQLRKEMGERDAQHHQLLSEKSAIKAENRTHKKRLKQLQEEHSATVVQLQQLHEEAIEERRQFSRQSIERGATPTPPTRSVLFSADGANSFSETLVEELTDRLERLAQKYRETDESLTKSKEAHQESIAALQRSQDRLHERERELSESRAECSRLVGVSVQTRLSAMRSGASMSPESRAGGDDKSPASPYFLGSSPQPQRSSPSQTRRALGGMGDDALGGSGTWAVDEVRVLEEQIAALKRERDAARDMREKDRQDGEANLRALEMHVRKELGAQVTELQEELAESKRQCGRLEAEVRNLSDMRRDLSQDLSRLEGELRTQRGHEKEAIKAIQSNTTAKEDLAAARSELAALKTQVENKETDIVALQGLLEEARRATEKAKEVAAEQLAAVRVASARELSKARLNVKTASDAEVNTARVQMQLGHKEEELFAARQDLADAQAALKEAQLKQQETDAALDAVRAAHRACPVVIEELKTQISTLQGLQGLAPLGGALAPFPEQHHRAIGEAVAGTSAPALKGRPADGVMPEARTPPLSPKSAQALGTRAPGASLVELGALGPLARSDVAFAGTGERSTTPQEVVPLWPSKQEPTFTPASTPKATTPRVHSVGTA